jgi:penicillin-binding protein 1C
VRRRLSVVLLLGAAAVGALLALAWPVVRAAPPRVPDFAAVRAGHRSSDTWILDRHGALLQEVRTDPTVRRLGWVSLRDISPAFLQAVLASEDRRFYRHAGVDGQAFLGAALQRLTSGSRRGASTITMQVAALVAPGLRRQGAPRTLAQKWRQMGYAWALERRWSKAEVLEAYVNLVTFRGELRGIGAAAQVLFGKLPHGLRGPEGAVLAALIRAPNADPAALARRAWAIQQAAGIPATRDEIAGLATQATASPRGNGSRSAHAPHAAGRLLTESPGRPGEPIATTLDLALQRLATELLNRHLLAVRDERVQDGAILVADNQSGDILAYVGGSGALSSAAEVDGVRALRQAGSTLKPFLYGLALEKRLLTPASLLEDTPLDMPVAGGVYRPRNYDTQFRGLLSVRTALAGSVNVPAVRTLALVGEDAFVAQLQRLGFALKESGDFYGPALALGSADVSLWELVAAYRSLANGGRWSALHLVPAAPAAYARRVYSPGAAFLLSSILSDRESRSGTFGLENPLATPFWTAVKTGTSKDMRDNWCIGYSRRYTVGVWVGNFSGAPMRNVSGVTGAAPIWLELMAALHREVPSRPPAPPEGVVPAAVRFLEAAEPGRSEWFLAGTAPAVSIPAPHGDQPTILAPTNGTVLAIDPDIPSPFQRVRFEAKGSGGEARWMLDGAMLGSARGGVLWQPTPGHHLLSLMDPAGRALDEVEFLVRGSANPSAE